MQVGRFLFLIVFALGSSFSLAKEIQIHETVFLGQIYPSGRIYLKQFPATARGPVAEKDAKDYTHQISNPPSPLEALSPWPREVFVVNTDMQKAPGTKIARAWLVKVLHDDTTKKHGLEFGTEYIPGLEGMDSSHSPCGMSKNTQDTGFGYGSDDFFKSLSGHCESSQGVAVYRSDYVTDRSFRVIAFAKGLELAAFEIDAQRTPRPLQPGEKGRTTKPGYASRHLEKTYEEEEAELEMAEGGSDDCPFGRRLRSDARRLISAKLSRPAWDLELSLYRDPLCFMHWNDIYLLDVKKDGKTVRTLELVNYKGMQ